MRIKEDSVDAIIYFVAVDISDLKTRETGLSDFTVYFALDDGAATVMTTPTTAQLDATNMPGVYSLLIDEAAMTNLDAGNDTEELVLHITHASMAPVTRALEVYRDRTTAILEDTGELQTDWANAGRLDTILDTIAADVVNIDGVNIQAACDAALVANNLDHLIKVAKDTSWANTVTKESLLDLMTSRDDSQTYNRETDSLEAIRDGQVDANPKNHTATANTESGNTTLDGGSYADTETEDGVNYYKTGPGVAVGGFGLNCHLTFGVGAGRIANSVTVNGRFEAGAQRTIQVWAYNYMLAVYVQLSNSATDFNNSVSDSTQQYPLSANMVKADGEVKIRFTSVSEEVADVWWCDYVSVISIAQEAAGLTASVIATAVWGQNVEGNDERTMGYVLEHTQLVRGGIGAVTSASVFVLNGSSIAVADAYTDCLIIVEDKTDSHYETRRITAYTAGRQVTIDRPFTFLPETGDEYYIPSRAYVSSVLDLKGVTAGGNYTLGEAIKILTAWSAGKWQDKAGVAGTYQVLDPDNGTTVIMEVTPAALTPQRTVVVL